MSNNLNCLWTAIYSYNISGLNLVRSSNRHRAQTEIPNTKEWICVQISLGLDIYQVKEAGKKTLQNFEHCSKSEVVTVKL